MNLGLAHDKPRLADFGRVLKGSEAATQWKVAGFDARSIHVADAKRQWDRTLRLGRHSTRSIKTAILTLTTPLVIGLGIDHPTESGCLWHPTLGFPYIPGSASKGLTRGFAERHLRLDADELAWVFGAEPAGTDELPGECAGSVIFFDALPMEGTMLAVETIAPHHKSYHVDGAAYPSDTSSPEPLCFLSLKVGSRLGFAVGARTPEASDLLEDVLDWVALAIEFEGIGGKTSRGAGRGSLVKA